MFCTWTRSPGSWLCRGGLGSSVACNSHELWRFENGGVGLGPFWRFAQGEVGFVASDSTCWIYQKVASGPAHLLMTSVVPCPAWDARNSRLKTLGWPGKWVWRTQQFGAEEDSTRIHWKIWFGWQIHAKPWVLATLSLCHQRSGMCVNKPTAVFRPLGEFRARVAVANIKGGGGWGRPSRRVTDGEEGGRRSPSNLAPARAFEHARTTRGDGSAASKQCCGAKCNSRRLHGQGPRVGSIPGATFVFVSMKQ